MADDPELDDDAEAAAIRGEVPIERELTRDRRIVRFAVGANHGKGWRLDKYLHAILPTLSRSMIRRWLDAGHATIDGAVAADRAKLKPGQRVELRAPLPSEHDGGGASGGVLEVLIEDPLFLVCCKPAGVLAHQAGKAMSGTLINHVHDWLEARGRDPRCARLVNRIDRDTSGIVLVSLDDAAHARLATAMEARDLHKEYRAICHGVPDPSAGSWLDPIAEAGEESIAMRIDPDGKASHTDYEVIENSQGSGVGGRGSGGPETGRFALLRVLLHTGRQHQIRIHAAHHGHPLVGDWVYGTPCAELPGQALHAALLEFPHPVSGATVRAEAPLPSALSTLWERVRTGTALTPTRLSDEQRSKLGLAAQRGLRRPAWMSEDEFAAMRREAGEI
ncbi:MAG: RluA family pseudouridine synthase [Planctomycetes bacterium]|nr:RluA family pseudouridine synthase [Planctomycetota bacterium]